MWWKIAYCIFVANGFEVGFERLKPVGGDPMNYKKTQKSSCQQNLFFADLIVTSYNYSVQTMIRSLLEKTKFLRELHTPWHLGGQQQPIFDHVGPSIKIWQERTKIWPNFSPLDGHTRFFRLVRSQISKRGVQTPVETDEELMSWQFYR